MTTTTNTAAAHFVDAQDVSVRPGEQVACALRNSQIVALTTAALRAFALPQAQASALAASVGYSDVATLVADLVAERDRCAEAPFADGEEERLYCVRRQFCDQAASRLRDKIAKARGR